MHSRTWLRIGGLLCLCLMVGLIAALSARSVSAVVARADSGDEAAALRELAGRFLIQPGAGPGTPGQSADLLPGQLPADLPLALPLPPGARLVGSVVRRRGGSALLWDVILDAPGAPTDLLTFYRGQLLPLGWTTPPSGPFGGGFLATAPDTGSATYCGKAGGPPVLVVTAAPAASGGSDVRIAIDASNAGACAIVPLPVPGPPRLTNRLPALTPPPGLTLVQGGSGSYGGERTTSDTTALTDRSAGELAAYYGAQLQAAGWTRVASGGEGGPFVWSVWNVPGDGGYQGMLSVLEGPGVNRRDLHVQVETAPSQADSGAAPGGGSTSAPAPPVATQTAVPLPVTRPPLPLPPGTIGSGPVPPTALPFPSVGVPPLPPTPAGGYAPAVAPSVNGPFTATPVVPPVAPPRLTATPSA